MSTSLRWTPLPARALASDESLRNSWDLLNAARLDLPFLSATSVIAALDIFGRGDEKLLVARAEGNSPVAMLVVARDGAFRWSTFQPSQIPLGAWVAQAGVDLDELARQVSRSGCLGLCLVLSVTQVDPTMAARAADDRDTLHGDFVETAWLDVEGSFDAFWSGRGKNLRQNMRKQRNKLAAEGTTTELRVLRAEADVPGILERYGAMESQGWKAGQGTAIHPDNDQGRYYARLFRDAAQRGELLVFEYLFDGRTVAMDMGVVRQGVLVVLKTTYDETVPKTLSPAALLREDALKWLFDASGVRRIEYYGRVMDWHTKLTDRKRMLYHLTCYRWPAVKRLALMRRPRPQPAVAATEPGVAEPA